MSTRHHIVEAVHTVAGRQVSEPSAGAYTRRASAPSSLRRFAVSLLAAVMLGLLVVPLAGAFALHDYAVTFTDESGEAATQAGAHPFALTTALKVETEEREVAGKSGRYIVEATRNLRLDLPPGLSGDVSAVPICPTADFVRLECSLATVVGKTEVEVGELGATGIVPPASVFNLVPPPGAVAKLGFVILGVPVTVELRLSEQPPYNLIATVEAVSQVLEFFSATTTVWGVPAASAHDAERGGSAGVTPTAFMVSPRACRGALPISWTLNTWAHPGDLLTGGAFTQSFVDCGKLGLAAGIMAQPTSRAASSATGLDFTLGVTDEGFSSVTGFAGSDIERVEVALPEGMSVNPSQAEGLEVCTQTQLARERSYSGPGAGCPEASKIGSIEVETPALPEKLLKGSLYVAKPYENPFNSLIALYIVIKDPELGISVVQPAKVTPNPTTGQLVTTTEEMPQLPFSHFRLHFREGTRSPLVTPPSCDADRTTPGNQPYAVTAKLYPYSGGAPVTSTSTFQIISGPDNSPCPTGGLPPFHPDLTAGTLNNAAGSFSPFNVKITRTDSEQEITHFSIKLPPGVAGKLAGIPACSDAQIAQATSRTGPHGGQEELDSPSCPAASQVGRSLAGAGVGPSLAYAPGKVYLAGPYHGHPLSLVAITSGVVGPFDIGTVVVRLAIDVNPETGEVFLDSTGSDPIPHIIKGIPVHLRDIRAYTDRPEFTFNPTSCERKSTAATVLGSGLDFVSEADDNPFVSTSPFQAADCAALPFKPKLTLRLIGGTKRGAHPALKAFLRMRGFGEAGVARARVTLPRSEFIENAHFDTICTRVQFKQAGGNGEACPAGSIYGWARAKTPILADPLEGPIFLRSSEHELPDVVASLRGQQIDVHLIGHVDSVKGQLRNTFETVPDAPVDWASFNFKGAKKGLFVNSTNLCKRVHRAKVEFSGQNGKRANYGAPLKVKCKGKHKAKKKQAKTHKRARR